MISPQTIPDTLDIASHYDELDPFYRRLWGEHLHRGYSRTGRETREESVFQLLKLVSTDPSIRSGHQISDFGCGYGATAWFLAERFSCHVTGYTVSEAQYEYARSRVVTHGSCRYVLGDWTTQPVPAESTDVVLAIESSEHIADKHSFFKRASAELRPGGQIALAFRPGTLHYGVLTGRRPSERRHRHDSSRSMATSQEVPSRSAVVGDSFDKRFDQIRSES